MAEKDVDEQFAAIMSHWDEEALGLDPFGDPTADADLDGLDPDREGDDGPRDEAPEPPAAESPTADATVTETALTPSPPPEAPVPPVVEARTERQEPAAEPEDAVDDEPAPRAGSAWRQHNPPEVEEHFEPPPPAPLPSAEDKHFWTMLAALIGGPLIFLYLLLFNRDGNGWWMTFALLVSIAGFVLLVLRQPNERDEDDHGIRL